MVGGGGGGEAQPLHRLPSADSPAKRSKLSCWSRRGGMRVDWYEGWMRQARRNVMLYCCSTRYSTAPPRLRLTRELIQSECVFFAVAVAVV